MCVCVCVCVSVCDLRVEGKHSADTADFLPEGEMREEKKSRNKRREKIENRYRRKILMPEWRDSSQ